MASIGTLTASLALESAAFIRDMSKAQRAVASNTAKMNRSLKELERSSYQTRRAFDQLKGGVVALAGALGISLLVRNVVRTSAEFQRLQSSLKTVTGSTEAATAAFAQIQKFAATTPYDLQQVTSAFIKLKALGLDPSMEALQSYGNTASAMGKQLNDFIEAVADAATGEFERLKEFGIRAKSQGDQVTFTFQNVATTIGKNAQEIEGYLRAIGEVQFAGAMDEQAKTLGGALSNAQDAAQVFAFEIGRGGLADAVADLARQFADLSGESVSVARQVGSVLGTAVRGLGEVALFAARNFREIATALTAFLAIKAASVIFDLAMALFALTKQAIAAAKAMFAMSLTSKANVKALILMAATVGAVTAAWALFEEQVGGDLDQIITDATTALDDLNRTTEGTGAAADKAAENLEDYIRELVDARDQAKHLAMAQAQGEEALALVNTAMEIHAAQQRLNITFTDEQRRAITKLIEEREGYLQQQQAIIDAEAEAARQAEEAAEARQAAIQANIELLQEPFKNALRSVQDTFASTFEDIFNGGVDSFSDLADAAKRIFIRLAAEIATLLIFRPQVVMGAGSLAGVAGIGQNAGGIGSLLGGDALGSIGSSINSFGASLGFASAPSAVITGAGQGGAFAAGAAGPPALAGSLTSATLLGTLGAAGIGALGGGILASLTGGNTTGGSIGGALGAGLGFAVGGPIGGIIGGLVGGGAGSLFGGEKTVGGSAAVTIKNGQFVVGASGATGTDVGPFIQAAQSVADTLNQLANQFGLTATSVKGIGNRFQVGSGQGLAGFVSSSPEQLLSRLLKAGALGGASDELSRVFRKSSAGSLVSNLNLLSQVPGLLGAGTSAFEQAMNAVNDNFDKVERLARKFGLSLELVAEARERELEAIEAQARAPFLTAAGTIVDFLNAQSLTEGSSLSPTQRLVEAQRQFSGLLTRVRGGETGLAQNLTSAAGTLLDIGRQNFASSIDFSALESSVRSSLLGVSETLASDEFFDAQVEAIKQQTEVQHEDSLSLQSQIEALRNEIRLLSKKVA